MMVMITEQFVEDHRVGCDELLALQPIDEEARCICIIELGKL